MSNAADPNEAPGWNAIDLALARIYGDVEPLHYAPALPSMFGGNDPLNGVSAYLSRFGGRTHWHFVTYGYSELFAKESDDPSTSGYGFEMTMRAIDPESTDTPPAWAISVLQALARYVFRTGNVFEAGHHSTMNGPIALGRETDLVAAAFVRDPELGSIETPNGHVDFVQLVGLTADEYDAVRDWNSSAFMELAAERDPAATTVLDRKSWLADASFKARVDEGIRRDGSSMSMVYLATGSWETPGDVAIVGIAANGLEDVRRLVRGRLAFGRTAYLRWPEGSVSIESATESGHDDAPTLRLDARDQGALLELPVVRGDYPLPSGRVVVRVIPIEIYDGTRTKVERVVG